MTNTLRDIGRLILKPYVMAVMLFTLVLSTIVIDSAGYLVWRRFPLPLLVIATAFIWLKISKAVNQPQLSKMVKGMVVGLCLFGAFILAGAFIDAFLWAETGYLASIGTMALWGWITFQSYRGLQVLEVMPAENKLQVTMSTADIIVQMTETQQRIEKVVADSKTILKNTQLKFS